MCPLDARLIRRKRQELRACKQCRFEWCTGLFGLLQLCTFAEITQGFVVGGEAFGDSVEVKDDFYYWQWWYRYFPPKTRQHDGIER